MAVFYNRASLSYSGGTADSNIVLGEIIQPLQVTKTAVEGVYSTDDTVTYVISLNNSSDTPLSGITLTDNLGEYTDGGVTTVPLTFNTGTVLYYINGELQPTPSVTSTSPLVIEGISVPANGNAIIVYSTTVNNGAPPIVGGSVTNTVTASGQGVAEVATENETIVAREAPLLTITKELNPVQVVDNSVVTYTLTIRNFGNLPAQATDNIVLNDTFDPILSDITVTVNGVVVTEGTAYTYNETTGEFATVAGTVTVPAATFTQDPQTGEWITSPGVTVVTVKGTI